MLLELRLLDEDGRASRPLLLWRRADREGRVRASLELPEDVAGRGLELRASATSSRWAVQRLLAAAPIHAPAPPQALAPALRIESDLFEGALLDSSWTIHNPAFLSHELSGGALRLTPTVAGLIATWFNDSEGPYVYKVIGGDFDVTSVVHVESSISPGAPAPLQFRLGGLMVRDVASSPGQRNSAHIAVGSGSGGFPLAVEDKTTFVSTSNFFFHAIPSQDLELRITRVGDLLSRFYRVSGATSWTLMRADLHPELGPTAQVGMMVYSNNSPVDIRASFESILFH